MVTKSEAADKGVLLEAKAAADTSACRRLAGTPLDAGCPLASWTADTEPCGDGHDDRESGWVGVVRDAP